MKAVWSTRVFIQISLYFFCVILFLSGCTTPAPTRTYLLKEKDLFPIESRSAGPPAEKNRTKRTKPEETEAAASRIDPVAAHLKKMPLRDRIAQRFITYVPRDFTLEETDNLLRETRPAGIILYKWNYKTAEEVKSLTSLIHAASLDATAGIGPFICVDQEGGRVTAFPFPELVRLPSQFELGRRKDENFIRAVAYVNAVQMMELGCNMNLAPVLDLVETGDSSIIGDRSYGSDPVLVSAYARAYLEAASAAGLIPVAKHFPGHGVTRIDSHSRLPVVDVALKGLLAREIVPFKAAVDAGLPVIMTAHILYPAIDEKYPATLSKRILTDILRKELGFQGVIMSDGLEMGALSRHYPIKETLKTAIEAGVDLILLYTRYDLKEMIAMVEELVREGSLSEAQIDAGTERVLRLKKIYHLLTLPAKE
jgi:beta-N-acetylhexosaminidase